MLVPLLDLWGSILEFACGEIRDWKAVSRVCKACAERCKQVGKTILREGCLFAYPRYFLATFKKCRSDDAVYTFKLRMGGLIRKLGIWKQTRRHDGQENVVCNTLIFANMFAFQHVPSQICSNETNVHEGSSFYIAWHPTGHFALVFFRSQDARESYNSEKGQLVVEDVGSNRGRQEIFCLPMENGTQLLLKTASRKRISLYNRLVARNRGMQHLYEFHGSVANRLYMADAYVQELKTSRRDLWEGENPENVIWDEKISYDYFCDEDSVYDSMMRIHDDPCSPDDCDFDSESDMSSA